MTVTQTTPSTFWESKLRVDYTEWFCQLSNQRLDLKFAGNSFKKYQTNTLMYYYFIPLISKLSSGQLFLEYFNITVVILFKLDNRTFDNMHYFGKKLYGHV